MQRIGEEIVQQRDQLLGQLLVEEQAHESGGWGSRGSAFAFSRVRQAGPDIFARELGKIGQDPVFRHPTRQIPENIAHRDSGTANARLSKPDCRIDGDAIRDTHGPSLRQVVTGRQKLNPWTGVRSVTQVQLPPLRGA
jgi:hypothetical protein